MSESESVLKPPKLRHVPSTVVIAPPMQLVKLFRKEFLSQIHESPERANRSWETQPLIASAIPWSLLELDSNESVGLVGPCIGAPACTMAVETFIAGGTKRILLLSVAGGIEARYFDPALQELPRLYPGALVLPSFAVSEEGTSRAYGCSESSIHPADLRYQQLCNERLGEFLTALEQPKAVTCGLWSTDAPFQESPAKIRTYLSLRALAVDMEYASLLHLSNQRGFTFAAFFTITDMLGDTWQPAFAAPSVHTTMKNSCRFLGELVLRPLSATRDL